MHNFSYNRNLDTKPKCGWYKKFLKSKVNTEVSSANTSAELKVTCSRRTCSETPGITYYALAIYQF